MAVTVLSAQTIDRLVAEGELGIEPYSQAKTALGMSYGLSSAGYDIRVGSIDRKLFTRANKSSPAPAWLVKPGEFVLLASLERLKIPKNVVAFVHDKSTLARRGLALQNTVLEPGWEGYITLELSNHSQNHVQVKIGQPIAQLVFHLLDEPTSLPYVGKYQNQGAEPTEAIFVDDPEPSQPE